MKNTVWNRLKNKGFARINQVKKKKDMESLRNRNANLKAQPGEFGGLSDEDDDNLTYSSTKNDIAAIGIGTGTGIKAPSVNSFGGISGLQNWMNKSKTLNSARAENGPTIIDSNPNGGSQSARGVNSDKNEKEDGEEKKANPLDEQK
jgi:hypothetical protein